MNIVNDERVGLKSRLSKAKTCIHMDQTKLQAITIGTFQNTECYNLITIQTNTKFDDPEYTSTSS